MLRKDVSESSHNRKIQQSHGDLVFFVTCQQVLQGLSFMHSRYLIHRDLKPSSVLVDVEGKAMITNLGNLRQLAKTNGQAASVVGTSCYFAPERIVGTSFTNSVDVWALGITMLEVAVGEFPFHSHQNNYMALLEQIVDCESPVKEHRKYLSQDLEDFLSRCLQKHPRDRPSVQALLLHPFVSPDGLEEGKKTLKVLVSQLLKQRNDR
mmetsp:Transcript_39828/g.125111  ORF Transcript_39828/g.125111 Transcript_39828/m.125111 type:complete len:208 (-) Transcript_39828:119-742(-)